MIGRTGKKAILMGLIGGVGALGVATAAPADHGTTGAHSFTSMQAGFTQELYGVGPEFFGGVAFAPDGDPLVDFCQFGGSGLRRFDKQGVAAPVGGSLLHPSSVLASNAGCGLTNHPNGDLYSNTSGGVTRLNADTGAVINSGFGPAGNALGIAPDPQTGDLVYVGSDGTLHRVDAALTTTSVFSTATAGHFLDGIYFDPSGNYLFVADRSGGVVGVTILRRDGTFVQTVATPDEPDGIAFHTTAPQFVVTNNTDGTMYRIDFPGNDFSQPGVLSTFASGGFRGDLSQVGPDSCLYVTQAGTRYADDSTSGENSLVRICPGFAPPPGVGDPEPEPPVEPCEATQFGSDGADRFTGTSAVDRYAGLAGNDSITGGSRGDCLLGGDGADRINGGSDADTISGGAGSDPELVGGSGNDVIHGGAGADAINGGSDNDTIHADDGEGGDTIICGSGNDTAHVDAGDTVGADCESVIVA